MCYKMKNTALYNGNIMPEIGFGTWKAPTGKVTVEAVRLQLNADILTLIVQQFMEMKKKLG